MSLPPPRASSASASSVVIVLAPLQAFLCSFLKLCFCNDPKLENRSSLCFLTFCFCNVVLPSTLKASPLFLLLPLLVLPYPICRRRRRRGCQHPIRLLSSASARASCLWVTVCLFIFRFVVAALCFALLSALVQ